MPRPPGWYAARGPEQPRSRESPSWATAEASQTVEESSAACVACQGPPQPWSGCCIAPRRTTAPSMCARPTPRRSRVPATPESCVSAMRNAGPSSSCVCCRCGWLPAGRLGKGIECIARMQAVPVYHRRRCTLVAAGDGGLQDNTPLGTQLTRYTANDTSGRHTSHLGRAPVRQAVLEHSRTQQGLGPRGGTRSHVPFECCQVPSPPA